MNYTQNMIYDATDHIGKQLLAGGYERDLLRAVKRELHAGMPTNAVIIDVGAHVGNFASFVAQNLPEHALAEAQILAFEPNPENFAYLEKNAQNLGFQAFNFAVTDEYPSCSIEPGPPGNSGMAKVKEGGDIPCVFLDDMVDDTGTVHIIKIDVEGHELAVLRTAYNIICRHMPLVICEAHTKEKFDELDAYLSKFGLQCTGQRYCATPTYIWA